MTVENEAEILYPIAYTREETLKADLSARDLQEMQQQSYIAGSKARSNEAKDFAEWCSKNNWVFYPGTEVWVQVTDFLLLNEKTTEQLFDIFKPQHNG